jgi:hypothetical protein
MAGNEGPKELRIGDAERTAAADELAEHYAQGRLSTEEHHERLDRVWAARTPSDLAPVFSDLPGSAYQSPPAYAGAEHPGVGQERPRRGQPTKQGPFPAPPFGRPPFGRPPYAGPRGRSVARRFGLLPMLLRVLLVVLLVALVLTHLPFILIGLLVWVVLTHKHRRWHAYQGR